jgi:NitT/TauT family transport system permease protein
MADQPLEGDKIVSEEVAAETSQPEEPGFMRRLGRTVRERPELVLSPVLFVLIVGGWELGVKIFEVPRIVLPAPSAIVNSLVNLVVEGELVRHFGVTLYETVAGFLLGSLAGLLLGALVSQFRLVEKTLYPYIVAFQTLPKVAIAPIIIIWAGYGLSSKIIIAAMIAFFPLLVNTIVGLNSTDPVYIEMLSSFTASPWQIFRMVKVPMALPFIFAGLDIAGVLSVIGAIVGEFVGAREGLGYVILIRNFNLDMAGVFAVLIVLSMLGIGIHLTISWLQRRVVFWAQPETERVIGA